jgi:hypothetical protein
MAIAGTAILMAVRLASHAVKSRDREIGIGMIGMKSRGDTETMVITGRGVIDNTKTTGITNQGDIHASPIRTVDRG